jgi:hypothetical protein
MSAIADVCAELGNDAVQIAELHANHLPGAQFSWRRLEKLRVPSPRQSAGTTRLVRRVLHDPRPLSAIPRENGTRRLKGPYVLSGGWWNDASTSEARTSTSDSPGTNTPGAYCREYYYLDDGSGRLLWLYHDTTLKKWMLQGIVE